MSYSIDAITDGCYENTTCLINKFDIRDEEKLKKVEADITFAKATILESNPISDKFDLEHYKAIHRFLFEDIYDWAGTFRTVDMAKKGTSFCSEDQLDDVAKNCFGRLAENNLFSDLDRDACLYFAIEPLHTAPSSLNISFITFSIVDAVTFSGIVRLTRSSANSLSVSASRASLFALTSAARLSYSICFALLSQQS